MKRLALEYVKHLKSILTSATTVGNDPPPTRTSDVKMGLTADGFPIIPLPWNGPQYKKEQLEELMSEYMSAHYGRIYLLCCLNLTGHLTAVATGRIGNTVPWGKIEGNIGDFIEPQYRPKKWVFKYPRNMKRHEIIAFFNHVAARQEKHTPTDAFRFKHIMVDRAMVKAQYSKTRKSDRSRQSIHTREPSRGPSVSNMDMDSLIQMDKTPEVEDRDEPASDGHVMVGIAESQLLRAQGVEIPLPCNGPDDGPPQYAIPTGEYNRIQEMHAQSSNRAEDIIDPSLRTNNTMMMSTLGLEDRDRPHLIPMDGSADADPHTERLGTAERDRPQPMPSDDASAADALTGSGGRPRPRAKKRGLKQSADALAASEAQTMTATGSGGRALRASTRMNVK